MFHFLAFFLSPVFCIFILQILESFHHCLLYVSESGEFSPPSSVFFRFWKIVTMVFSVSESGEFLQLSFCMFQILVSFHHCLLYVLYSRECSLLSSVCSRFGRVFPITCVVGSGELPPPSSICFRFWRAHRHCSTCWNGSRNPWRKSRIPRQQAAPHSEQWPSLSDGQL